MIEPNKVKTFIISDTHFGHANIIKYCDRPFSDAREMDEALIANWNSVVAPDDIVWHLGDFCMGRERQVQNYLHRLNGNINLVTGNHDRYSQRKYMNLGFNHVYDRPVVIMKKFILSHAPMEYDTLPLVNVYGHIHNSAVSSTYTEHSVCMCVERWSYMPVLLNEALMPFLDKGQQQLTGNHVTDNSVTTVSETGVSYHVVQ